MIILNVLIEQPEYIKVLQDHNNEPYATPGIISHASFVAS